MAWNTASKRSTPATWLAAWRPAMSWIRRRWKSRWPAFCRQPSDRRGRPGSVQNAVASPKDPAPGRVETRMPHFPAKLVLMAAALASLASPLPARAAEDVKIGLLFDVTGPVANFVPPMLDAARLAVDQVNAQGGILD